MFSPLKKYYHALFYFLMNVLYIFLKRNVLYLTITSLRYVVKFYIFFLTFFSTFLLFLGFIKVEIHEILPSFVQKKKKKKKKK